MLPDIFGLVPLGDDLGVSTGTCWRELSSPQAQGEVEVEEELIEERCLVDH